MDGWKKKLLKAKAIEDDRCRVLPSHDHDRSAVEGIAEQRRCYEIRDMGGSRHKMISPSPILWGLWTRTFTAFA
jgi:hypothetical protein